MDELSFYKNTLSLLKIIEDGSFKWLIDEGWLSKNDVDKMLTVLSKLEFAHKIHEEEAIISNKGLQVLSYFEEDMAAPELENVFDNIIANSGHELN